jgi:hypothetical protein
MLAVEIERTDEVLKNVKEFLNWYQIQMAKEDCEINYILFGIDAQNKYFILNKKFPEIQKKTGIECYTNANNRKFSWLSEKGWIDWNRKEMLENYLSFIEDLERREVNIYPITYLYMFADKIKNYDCCPYLSYAYKEKRRWEYICKSLKENFNI